MAVLTVVSVVVKTIVLALITTLVTAYYEYRLHKSDIIELRHALTLKERWQARAWTYLPRSFWEFVVARRRRYLKFTAAAWGFMILALLLLALPKILSLAA